MKNFKLSLISLILAVSMISVAFGQQYEFKVMATKGNLTVQKEKSNSWNPIKLGTQVFGSDKIKLGGDNPYMSLVHKSGKTLEIKKSGTYTVSDLTKQIGTKGAGVSKKFADYLMDELGDSDDLLADGDHRKNMGVTGSVTRAIPDQPFIKKDGLRLNSPRKVNLINSVFTFRWISVDNTKEYEFVLTDRFDKPVMTKEVHGNSITLNADELKLARNTYYFWKVRAKGDKKSKSDDACFLVLSDDKIKSIQDTIETIKNEVGEDNNPTSKIILAAFYEQNYIIDEALRSYREAVALAPDVDFYQKLYQRFLNRINVTEK